MVHFYTLSGGVRIQWCEKKHRLEIEIAPERSRLNQNGNGKANENKSGCR